jgi:signal transduction histidine kinase
MNITKLRRYNPLFRASALRVLLEVLIIQAIVTIAYPLLAGSILSTLLSFFASNDVTTIDAHEISTLIFKEIDYILFGLISIGWAILRWQLRPGQRARKRQLVYEIGMSTILGLELILCQSILSAVLVHFSSFNFFTPLTRSTDLRISTISRLDIYVLASVCACAFFFLRMGMYIWLLWDHLRKTHIRWALTHAHLMIIVIGAAVVYLLIIIFYIINNIGRNQQFFPFLASPLLVLCVIIFLLVIGIAIVLPPSALFSYLFSRRLVRRIENLAQGAGELRNGNYSVRVPVEGRDEVARLQTDFNAMAADLEHTLYELKEERDNVGTLLNARRELIASVSHELRTPVATIRSYLESALMGWQEQPPETLRQDLQVMEEQMIRLQALINDLFTLSRAEVGRLETRCRPTNIALLVKRVAETVSPVAWRGSRIEVIADIASNDAEFPYALVDENRLEQVLQNLLHNGIRHTPPGGIIVLSAHAEAKMVVLQVKDTGEGIAPEELARVWERFYRAENTRNKGGSGSGLGLAIVKELTEAMGGTVSVDSVVGQGTCFAIRVPRVNSIVAEPVHANIVSSLEQAKITKVVNFEAR